VLIGQTKKLLKYLRHEYIEWKNYFTATHLVGGPATENWQLKVDNGKRK